MIERHVVDHSDEGVGTGMVLGIIFVLLAVVVALFFVFGGPSRFTSAPSSPSQTNVNVPQSQPQSGPNINIPRQVDVNVNPPAQQPAQQQPAQQQPAQQQPAQQQPGQQQPAQQQPAPAR